MEKSKCIDVFNTLIRGTPISFKKDLFPMYSEYLTENNIENYKELINLVVQNPQLIYQVIPQIIDYYCRKYCILSIKIKELNKTILYYE